MTVFKDVYDKRLRNHMDIHICFTLFLFGIIVLLFRNGYIFGSTTLYGEDATWMGQIISDGLFSAIINARSDYFVLGNILLLALSYFLNFMFFSYNLLNLPIFICIISYSFYSFLAICPIIFLKNKLHKKTCLILWILILLCPFGYSNYTILGRVLNLGYAFTFLCFCIMNWRIDISIEKPIYKIILCDIALFICAGTNPICFVIIGVGYFIMLYNKFRNKTLKEFKRSKDFISFNVLISILLALGIIILLRMKGNINPYETGFNSNEIIEFLFRNLYYSFIFPFYSFFNNKLVFILVILTLIIIVYILLYEKGNRMFFIYSLFTLIFATTITLLTRYGLTTVLNKYSVSMIDVYYYGQNLLSLIPFVFVIEKFATNKRRVNKIFAVLFLMVVSYIYLFNLDLLFDMDYPKYKLSDVNYAEEFRKAYDNETYAEEKGNYYFVKQEVEGFYLKVTRKHIENTIKNLKVHTAEITDENFDRGVYKNGFMLLFENTNSNKAILETCDILYSNGVEMKVQKVEIGDEWIYVYYDSLGVNPEMFKSYNSIGVIN